MKIGVDIDDVLTPTLSKFLEEFNNYHLTPINIEDVTCYHFTTISYYESHYIFNHLFNFQLNNLKHFSLMEGVYKVLQKIRKTDELYIVTARDKSMKKDTLEWLEEKLGVDTFSQIHFLSEHESNCKSSICLENKIDIMIEDAPHHAENISKKGIKVLLMNAPWNFHLKENKNIIKVNNWHDIEEELYKIKQEE